jgi:hypothetical protein
MGIVREMLTGAGRDAMGIQDKEDRPPMSFDAFVRAWHKSQEPFWKEVFDKDRKAIEEMVEKEVFGGKK